MVLVAPKLKLGFFTELPILLDTSLLTNNGILRLGARGQELSIDF